MGMVLSLYDKLTNALSGTGTGRDVRSANYYAAARPLTQHEIAAAYSGSGLLRKIIGTPALDMVREWRDWSGLGDDEASAVWDEEKRLGLRQKVRQVEVLRGMGGGALVLGLPGNPSEPARDIGKRQLAFVHVVSRWHLTFDALQDDATAEGYGEPAMWKMQTQGGQQSIHPSRVVPFRADTSASLAMPGSWAGPDAFWGESTVQQVLDAVKDNDTARAAFAALIHKARLLRLGIPGLMDIASTEGGESKIQTRLAAVVMAESIHNATIYDAGNPEDGKGGETITDAQYNFAGAKDVLNSYGEFVAAISDIPATRLLGRAPEGLNSSGDSQQRDWNKAVRARQTLDLGPCLERVDRYLVQSAVGKLVPTCANEWAPLDQPTEKERAERWKTQMEAADKLATMGAIPDEAFNRGLQSLMIEEGYMPELEAALSEMSDDERYGIEAGEAEGGDPDDLTGAGGEGLEAEPPRRAANDSWFFADAKMKPLYVHRKLLNGADLIKWAKAQGLETTLAAEDMHVTVLFSRQPVDPMKMGENWSSEPDGGLIVKAGGPRAIERFDGGAVVLQFASSNLAWRHRDMIEAGGSHDFDEYHPHVTLSYSAPADLDLDAIKPFSGELRFGPELFEPLDLDWKSKVTEK